MKNSILTCNLTCWNHRDQTDVRRAVTSPRRCALCATLGCRRHCPRVRRVEGWRQTRIAPGMRMQELERAITICVYYKRTEGEGDESIMYEGWFLRLRELAILFSKYGKRSGIAMPEMLWNSNPLCLQGERSVNRVAQSLLLCYQQLSRALHVMASE